MRRKEDLRRGAFGGLALESSAVLRMEMVGVDRRRVVHSASLDGVEKVLPPLVRLFGKCKSFPKSKILHNAPSSAHAVAVSSPYDTSHPQRPTPSSQRGRVPSSICPRLWW